MCKGCDTGHVVVQSVASLSMLLPTERCQQCPAGYYCPNQGTYKLCPGGMVSFLAPLGGAQQDEVQILDTRDGMSGSTVVQFVTVPSSPVGSSLASHCSCTAKGGFREARGAFLHCEACPSGWFAPPGEGCSVCPVGKYSQATLEERGRHVQSPPTGQQVCDLLKKAFSKQQGSIFTPITLSGVVAGTVGFPVYPYPTVEAAARGLLDLDASASLQDTMAACALLPEAPVGGEPILVGATECTPCPPEAPSTKREGTASREGCSVCPDEHFLDPAQGVCKKCREPCAASTHYEHTPCTDTTNRVCRFCDRAVCGYGEYPSSCPDSDPLNPSRGCKRCNNKPEGDESSEYVAFDPALKRIDFAGSAGSAAQEGDLTSCPWRCKPGFFVVREPGTEGASNLAAASRCQACTAYNATTCPAGSVYHPCTGDADASCGVGLCDPKQAGMPSNNAEWVLAVLAGGGEIVRNGGPGLLPANGTLPNQGCLWACKEGYREVQAPASGVRLCV